MYDFVDRRPGELGNAGRFTLWAMRGWNDAIDRDACPPLALYPGFNRLGASSALNDFHVASTWMRRESRVPLDLAPMKSLTIAENEAVLLALWRGVAREDSDLVAATLKLLVKTDAILPIARAMAGCCAQMKLAGLDLSTPAYAGDRLP